MAYAIPIVSFTDTEIDHVLLIEALSDPYMIELLEDVKEADEDIALDIEYKNIDLMCMVDILYRFLLKETKRKDVSKVNILATMGGYLIYEAFD